MSSPRLTITFLNETNFNLFRSLAEKCNGNGVTACFRDNYLEAREKEMEKLKREKAEQGKINEMLTEELKKTRTMQGNMIREQENVIKELERKLELERKRKCVTGKEEKNEPPKPPNKKRKVWDEDVGYFDLCIGSNISPTGAGNCVRGYMTKAVPGVYKVKLTKK